VTLNGTVTDAAQIDKVAEIAKGVPGGDVRDQQADRPKTFWRSVGPRRRRNVSPAAPGRMKHQGCRDGLPAVESVD
jgi:hypothetical protein